MTGRTPERLVVEKPPAHAPHRGDGSTDQSNSRRNLVNVMDVTRQPASVFS